MRFLKWALGLVLLLGVAFVVGGLVLPASTHVERSVAIARPPAEVFAVLNSFQRFNEWSPWAGLDPQAQYSYEGPASGAGAKMRWTSQKPEVGSGAQTILESVPDSKVVVDLDFGSQGKAIATYTIVAGGAGSRVTWGFDSKPSDNLLERWLGAWFGLLMDKLIGPDFERGLAKLKQVLESPPA
ncbi:SRPBCC family protein [Pseudoxanthomonas helianthi]|uniref:SRPBCC family protein n=1 Tax=Pseudoxanthomonas helianthi TaxID=1453541 RepID=A0A940X2L4_9GAMM|nr:SRPBCC family protein [Pseudoxanthomonas helianthi]MBP3983083.1 SRPBCC family protein [Pseudoxanthomonas helianthi]